MAQTLINYRNVNVYQDDTLILENVNMNIGEGEFVYLTGKVGSGKSSLLKTLYGELPCNGDKQQRKALSDVDSEATVLDFDMLRIRRKNLPDLRRSLGIIFQDFQLLTDRTVRENLRFVLRATGWKNKEDITRRIDEVLSLVEMTDKADKMPNELSGGEQQRIAIARAILNSPKLILADEPTGNLDTETGRLITELLRGLCKDGSSVLMITHNLSLLEEYPGRVFHCKNSTITELTNDSAALDNERKEADNDDSQGWKDLANEFL
ncbi:MAG: ATP-binding cassette domain-containing protein [Bacteroidaceae bacterium]|nr:ATP-binding cassette domain-containing protein [Bacteroidaceae bacterium]